MVWIYILKLEKDKYYVGRTKYPLKRIEDHKEGSGSRWTSIYKVISVIEQFEGDDYDEDKYLKIYMGKYGIDNVRGGSYCRENLSNEEINSLKRELNGVNNCCFRCGRNNHFVANCYTTTHIDGSILTSKSPKKVKQNSNAQLQCLSCKGNHDILDCPNKGSICYRCGRNDHWKITCTAANDINGKSLEPDLIGQVGSFIKSWWNSK